MTVGEGYAVQDFPPPEEEGKEWGWDIVVAEDVNTSGDVWMDDGVTLGDLAGGFGEDGVLRLVGRIVAV